MRSPENGPARRSTRFERAGQQRSRLIATRLGTALRDGRTRAGLSQRDVAARAGLSQTHLSYLERGLGAGAGLATWASVAAAVGDQLVSYLERASGTDLPRDVEHLKRENALITLAAGGGWAALPELAIDAARHRSRSIDVALFRPSTNEAIVAEVWDWFDDVGAGLRGLDAKVATLRRRLSDGRATTTVRGLYIVRDTRRNRLLIAELSGLFAARFPGNSPAWLKALTERGQPLPAHDGLLWSDRAGSRLQGSRLTPPVQRSHR